MRQQICEITGNAAKWSPGRLPPVSLALGDTSPAYFAGQNWCVQYWQLLTMSVASKLHIRNGRIISTRYPGSACTSACTSNTGVQAVCSASEFRCGTRVAFSLPSGTPRDRSPEILGQRDSLRGVCCLHLLRMAHNLRKGRAGQLVQRSPPVSCTGATAIIRPRWDIDT